MGLREDLWENGDEYGALKDSIEDEQFNNRGGTIPRQWYLTHLPSMAQHRSLGY